MSCDLLSVYLQIDPKVVCGWWQDKQVYTMYIDVYFRVCSSDLNCPTTVQLDCQY